jgi:superfamily II DNA/RNA helicase
LVLVPTRELAAQVSKELAALAGPKGTSVTTVYGGVGFGGQIKAMRRGTDVVVACPGRLADLVERGELFLDEVEVAVIDEADRMADMGFLPEVRRLLDRVRPDRQTLLFSATLDGAVDSLVTRYQRDPVHHGLAAEPDAVQSRHVFWKAERPERIRLTARIIGAQSPVMVFCRTKHGADRLARQLAREGVSAAAIHGDRSQGQRDRALAAFVNGKVQALVATDIAARGIHVDEVGCVVHFDPPAGEKDYVHRSGRTGRAGAAGIIVSLVSAEQDADVRGMQRRLGLPVGLETPDVSTLGDERRAALLLTPGQAPASTKHTPPRPKRRRRASGLSPAAGRPGRRPRASRTR